MAEQIQTNIIVKLATPETDVIADGFLVQDFDPEQYCTYGIKLPRFIKRSMWYQHIQDEAREALSLCFADPPSKDLINNWHSRDTYYNSSLSKKRQIIHQEFDNMIKNEFRTRSYKLSELSKLSRDELVALIIKYEPETFAGIEDLLDLFIEQWVWANTSKIWWTYRYS